MADTFTASLKARKIEQGAYNNSYATRFNEDMVDVFDSAIDGRKTISIGSSTSVSLAAMQSGTLSDSHYWWLVFTGTPASAVTLTVPASVTTKKYLIDNQTGQTMTVKYAATAGVPVETGDKVPVLCDGTTVIEFPALVRFKRTAAEIAAGVTPTNAYYEELDIRRYGAVGDYDEATETAGLLAVNATDNLTAIDAAILVAAEKGGGIIKIDGGDYYVSNTIDATGISNLYFYISPGTTLRSTRYTSDGGLLVIGGTGPVSSGISNVGVYGGGTLRAHRPDHDSIAAHQVSHAYSVGDYVLSTDTSGNTRAYYCKTAGTSGASSPPDVINGSDTDGTVVWQDADNDNVIGINGEGVLVEGMDIPEASGKFITVQTPNWTNVRIINNRCGGSNDKGIEVKGNTATTGQEAAFGDGVQIIGNTIQEAGYYGIEAEQSSFSSALNQNCRIIGNLVRSAGLIDATAAGIRVNRCKNVEVRGNKVLDSGGYGYHIRLCENVTGDLHSESAGLGGVHLQQNSGFSFSSIDVKTAATVGVQESSDVLGGYIGRLAVTGAVSGYAESSRGGPSPVVVAYSFSTLSGAAFTGALPTILASQHSAAKIQCFTLQITNDAGTLKHRFIDDIVNAGASSFVDRINNASSTLTATPTGADASTPFAAGGKIGSTQSEEFILDHTLAAAPAHGIRIANIVQNDSDTDLMVGIVRRSVIVSGSNGGVAMNRWHLSFRSTTAGAAFALDTSNIASGETIAVQVMMYLP